MIILVFLVEKKGNGYHREIITNFFINYEMDIKGVLKEHQKLLLSMLGVVVLASVIASTTSSDGGAWGLTDLDSVTEGTTNLNTSKGSSAVDNGNNNKYSSAPTNQIKSGVDYKADIVTSKGTFRIDLHEGLTPKTVSNFVFLANDGFYDGSSFHRVIPNFMIQGGDPLGSGFGGPGYSFEDEFVDSLVFEPYIIAMANSGPSTNGSQFFVTTKVSQSSHLTGAHTVFGSVVSGKSVVDAIEGVETNASDMPQTAVIIETINIIED